MSYRRYMYSVSCEVFNTPAAAAAAALIREKFFIQQFFTMLMEEVNPSHAEDLLLLLCYAAVCSVRDGVRYAVWLEGKQSGKQAVSQLPGCLQRPSWGGMGGLENSRSATAPSSLFALQWFSHQTCLLNQGPPSTKTANYVPMRCPPLHPVPFVCPPGLYHSVLCFILPPLFSFLLCLTYFSRSWSNGKTLLHLWTSPGVCATLSEPLWRMKKKNL